MEVFWWQMPVFAMRRGAGKSVKEGSEAGRDFKSVHRSICSLRTLSDGIGGGRVKRRDGTNRAALQHSRPPQSRGNFSYNYRLARREINQKCGRRVGGGLQLCLHLDLRGVFASVSRSTFIHPSPLLAPCTHLARRSSPVALAGDDKSATLSSFLPFQMSPKRASRCV